MTFSVLGRCPRSGRIGIAVTSSSPAVAARCASLRAGVGVAASQNVTDPRLGPALLDALAAGGDPGQALDRVRADAAHAEFRQLAVLSEEGRGAVWSGARTLGVHGGRSGPDWVVAGNLLAGTEVLEAAGAGFADSSATELEERLLDGLAAGLAAGGEAGPLHSAGLLAGGRVPWPESDLRVDWVDDEAGPIAALRALWELWAPQRDPYLTRALDPATAPAYGVPGDPDPGPASEPDPDPATGPNPDPATGPDPNPPTA